VSLYACLVRHESYACGGLLNLLIHFMLILDHGYLLVILAHGPFVRIHSCFTNLGIMVCIIA
jgi:hypothetical protein